MSHRHPGEQGGGKLKLLVALLITAGAVLAMVRIVPVYVKSYELESAMREEAKFAAVRNEQPTAIRQRLLDKAQQLNFNVKPQQIQVTRVVGGVHITVSYSVPVQLPGYTLTLNFQHSVDTASAY